MREALGIDPTDWLKRADPNPVPRPDQVLDGYSETPVVTRFTGPEVFYRAAGEDASGRTARAYAGAWWVAESVLVELYRKLAQYEGFLPQSMLRQALPLQYRAVTALCEDWNNMREIYRLSLPDGETLEGLVGPTKEQPQRSTMDPSDPTTPWLRGGAEQVYIKVKNPLWIFRASL